MKRIELIQVPHNYKVGDVCGPIEPNVTEDCIFTENGEDVGFYIRNIKEHSQKLFDFVEIANKEFRSKRVPKSQMNRTSGEIGHSEKVQQYSTILGSVPPRAHMRRPYPSISSVHQHASAETFVKAMLLVCRESEELILKYTPEIYKRQLEIIEETTAKQWRFGKLFTSSISNFNIAASFHTDKANLQGCVNVILAKRHHATGGNTTVPDYNATMDSCDNSMLVYPAWRNLHAVTPIVPTQKGGYRNSLVFYPLKAFKGL